MRTFIRLFFLFVLFCFPQAPVFARALPAGNAGTGGPEQGGSAREKEWTVLVFMNAKNDLGAAARRDINEMESAGSSSRVNVVVQFGDLAGAESPGHSTVRRYYIIKDNEPNNITSPVLEDLGNEDMGYPGALSAFGNWAKKKFPARHYLLIVWSHGTGWVKALPKSEKGISYDFEYGSNLTIPQLEKALRDMGGADIYASDACLMQMAEVAYQLKDHAGYIIGSQEDVPEDGFPYAGIFERLNSGAWGSVSEAAAGIVKAYSFHYEAKGAGTTLSAIRAGAMADFLSGLNAWKAVLLAEQKKALVRAAVIGTEKYKNPDYRDLYQFIKLAGAGSASPRLRETSRALLRIISDELIIENRTTGKIGSWLTGTGDYSNSNGISVYLPMNGTMDGYNELAWDHSSNWREFIEWYQSSDLSE